MQKKILLGLGLIGLAYYLWQKSNKPKGSSSKPLEIKAGNYKLKDKVLKFLKIHRITGIYRNIYDLLFIANIQVDGSNTGISNKIINLTRGDFLLFLY